MKRLAHGRYAANPQDPEIKNVSLFASRKVLSRAQAMAPREGFLYFTDLVQTLLVMWSEGRIDAPLKDHLLRNVLPGLRSTWAETPVGEKGRVSLKLRADIFVKATHRAEAIGLSGAPELARILLELFVEGEIQFRLASGVD